MPIAPSLGPRSASTLAHASSRDIIQPRPYPAWHPRGDFRKENAGWALSSPTRRWQVASAHTSILSGRTISCPNATHAATDCLPQSLRSAKRWARAHPALVYRHTPTEKPPARAVGTAGHTQRPACHHNRARPTTHRPHAGARGFYAQPPHRTRTRSSGHRARPLGWDFGLDHSLAHRSSSPRDPAWLPGRSPRRPSCRRRAL